MSWSLGKCEKFGCDEIGDTFVVLQTFRLCLCGTHHHDFDRWVLDRITYQNLNVQVSHYHALTVAYEGCGEHAAKVLEIAADKRRETGDAFSRCCMAWLDTPDKAEAVE